MNKSFHWLLLTIKWKFYLTCLLNDLNDSLCKVVAQAQTIKPNGITEKALLDQEVKDLGTEYENYESKVCKVHKANGAEIDRLMVLMYLPDPIPLSPLENIVL